jgi:phosphate-selective porin OprO and OprP
MKSSAALTTLALAAGFCAGNMPIAVHAQDAPRAAGQNAQVGARIEAIERQINALQAELQRVKASLATTGEELSRSRAEAAQQRQAVSAAQEESRQARETAKQAAAAAPAIKFVDGRPTIASSDGRYSLAVGASLHFDAAGYFQHPGGAGDTRAVPDLNSGVNLRRGRIYLVAKADDFTFNLTPDFGGSPDGRNTFAGLYEASLNYSGLKPATVSVGYLQSPVGIVDATNPNDFLFLERPSIVEVARDLAGGDARASLGVRAANERLYAHAYLTGPSYGAQSTPAGTTPLNDEQVGGMLRLAGRPLATPDANLHLGVSATKVFSPNQSAAGVPGVSRTALTLSDRPELRVDQNTLISTGALSASGAATYGLELAASYKNFLVQGELVHIDVDQLRAPGVLSPSLGFGGGYVEGSWVLTGESRPYLPAHAAFGNPVPARPLSFADGGFGALELVGRYSVIDLNDHVTPGIAQSVTGGVFGGRQEIATIGLNWYPNANIRFMLDYYFDTVNRLDATGRISVGQHFQALALRTQAAF